MNEFQKMAKRDDVKCDICGAVMVPMWGGGWDNDRMICSDGRDCGAEIVFPTSTPVDENDGENK